MKKVFLDNLPKKGGVCNKVNWKESVGCKVDFIYDDISGTVEIKSKDGFVLTIWNDIYGEFKIDCRNFIKCKFKNYLKDYLDIYEYDENNPRRVDLRGIKVGFNGIDWDDSVGKDVKFYYDDIEGFIKILSYKKQDRVLEVEYNNKVSYIKPESVANGMLGNLIGVYSKNHFYNIGEVVDTNRGSIKILETFRSDSGVKMYKYICKKDGFVGSISESNLKKGKGCKLCSNRIVIKGVNDLSTTHPNIVKYLSDKSIAFEMKYSDADRVECICDLCGCKKLYTMSTLSSSGFNCDECGDGVSFPEKFIMSVLKQCNVEYETHKRDFEWVKSHRKEYDFYIPSLNIIIETHGMQHYKESFTKLGGRTLQEEQENDCFKERLAKDNGINNYIVIDCRKSDAEWIKLKTLNSKLKELLDLSNVDWLKCEEFALKNIAFEVLEHYKNGLSIVEISNKVKLSDVTVRTYLVKLTKIGLCNYNPDDGRRYGLSCGSVANQVKCICLDNGLVTESIKDMAKQMEDITGEKFSAANISTVCNGRRKTHNGFRFEHYK